MDAAAAVADEDPVKPLQPCRGGSLLLERSADVEVAAEALGIGAEEAEAVSEAESSSTASRKDEAAF